MALSLAGAVLVTVAVVLLGLCLMPRAWPAGIPARQWFGGYARRREDELRLARLSVTPALYVWGSLGAPVALLMVGSTQSPVLGVVGLGAGLLAPRLYVRVLIGVAERRAEEEAPRLLSTLVSNLSAGNTYYEALQQAHRTTGDRWVREDISWILGQFTLDRPLADAIREVRRRVHSRNLGLVWDDLAICVAGDIPTSRARLLLAELASTVQFNVQVNAEVRARTSGQRAQIWLLAAMVPAMYVYLRTVSPELLSVLDDTLLGKYVLFPTAVALEVLGIWLSFRLSRVSV
ncbi:MAG: type II secretion system F family protein [Candidatus Dormibacteria bacterium]